MATLLFKLRNVPDDEADDVRRILRDNNIAFYETEAGRWRTGVDALWLPDASQLAAARSLLDAYQAERASTARRLYRERQASGDVPAFWQKWRENPWATAVRLIAVVTIVALMTLPLLNWLSP